MIRKNRKVVTLFFALLFAAITLFASFAKPAWAKVKGRGSVPDKRKYLLKSRASDDNEGKTGVHADPATFEKNFILSFDEKEYTITEIEKVVSEIIDPKMSDLEKYYTLAIWANKHVVYDWQFWSGGYYFDYYSHQWDAYGCMKEDEKSVCAGIAIFYSNLCHAAGLPCRFVRLNPEFLDHTINYIPDINGNAYYVDVTENVFLHSELSGDAFSNIDKDFAHITRDCTDTTFDYQTSANSELVSTKIKDCYDKPFNVWFNEYALHKNTGKIFKTPYVEKGSGVSGTNHAPYRNYISNFMEHPDIWFLDDFYKDPDAIKAKILAKELDEQLINISGVKKNYDCDTTDELEAAVAGDISVKYFPSVENGQVAPKTANLVKDVDYKVTYNNYDESTKTANFTVEGIGDYKGSYPFSIKMNSAVVSKVPVSKTGLIYNESPQELVEAGQAENGEMQYALGTETEVTGKFSTDIPTATDAGKYYIWYKVVGDESHGSTEPQLLEKRVSIAPIQLELIAEDMTITVGKTAVISPRFDKKMPAIFSFENGDEDIISVDKNGTVTGLKPGSGTVFIECTLKYPSSNYETPDFAMVTIDVVPAKAANPMTLKGSGYIIGKKVTIKYKRLKKKTQKFGRAKVYSIKNAKGKLSFKIAAVKKGKKSYKKMFRINKKTGKIAVKKGLKKGTYKVKVKVKAAGNAKYKASAWQAVVFKVVVK